MEQRNDDRRDATKFLTTSEDPGVKPWQIFILLAVLAVSVFLFVARP